jgi:beta-glucanase (GH16 family)
MKKTGSARKIGSSFGFVLILSFISYASYAALGDVNSDSNITIVDALLVAQYYVGLNPPNFTASNADVNANGSIDVVDALLIAQYYVGLITGFPGQVATPTQVPATPDPTPAGGYSLVWSDEFNYSGTPDPANWGYESGYVRNNEAQYYQQSNASCDGSQLVIEARRNDGGYSYTSSSLITQNKHQWTYGRFEMRGKIPCVTGSWPAWWAVGIGANGSWPKCGEIDMMEYYRNMLLANVLYQNSAGSQVWDSTTRDVSTLGAGWANNYHVWVMEWDANKIDLYCDDALLNTFDVNSATVGTYNPFRTSIWMFVNLAIGGNNGGDPSATTFPLRFYVDYIRVYQK